eukprot:COSAG04_NODE_3900_length_2438_cov_1.339034_4_plen_445_part_00
MLGKTVSTQFDDIWSQVDEDGSDALDFEEFERFYAAVGAVDSPSTLTVTDVSYVNITVAEERLLASSAVEERNEATGVSDTGATTNPLHTDADGTDSVAGCRTPGQTQQPTLNIDLSDYTGTDQAEAATWLKLFGSPTAVRVQGLELNSEGAQVLLKTVDERKLTKKVLLRLQHAAYALTGGLAGKPPLECDGPTDVSFRVDTGGVALPTLRASLQKLHDCVPSAKLKDSGFTFHLDEVIVSGHPLTRQEVEGLNAVSQTLTKFEASGCGLKVDSLAELPDLLTRAKSMVEMDLSTNTIDANSGKALNEAITPSSLQWIVVGNDARMPVHSTEATLLNAAKSDLGPGETMVVAAVIATNTELEEVTLRRNLLLGNREVTSQQEYDAHGDSVPCTYGGFDTLCEALKLSKIVRLDLCDCCLDAHSTRRRHPATAALPGCSCSRFA